ncbi:MAG TPA: glycosyltransferase [Thermoguttaceae bacterium]
MRLLSDSSPRTGPLVSVIIPTYNRRQFIADAIRSVLNQSYRNIELIVVDDGSDDGTFELVRSISPAIRYFWQPNAGVASARNRGLAEARGELIAFQDSDDIWHPRKLALQVAILRHSPSLGMAYTSHRIIDQHGTVIGARWKQLHSGRVTEALFQCMFIIMPSTVTRRSVFDRVGNFNTALCINSDYEFWLRASMTTDFFAIEESLVDERQTPCRLTGVKDEAAMLQYDMLLRFYHELGGIDVIRPQIARRALAKSAFRAARELKKQKYFTYALNMYAKSISHQYSVRPAAAMLWTRIRRILQKSADPYRLSCMCKKILLPIEQTNY